MTVRRLHKGTPDALLAPTLEASLVQAREAKRARRLATLEYVRGMRADAEKRHQECVEAEGKAWALLETAIEIETEARKALEG